MKPEGEHNFFLPKPLVVSPLNCHSADKIASYAGYMMCTTKLSSRRFKGLLYPLIHSNLSTPFDFTMTGAVQTSSVEEFSA